MGMTIEEPVKNEKEFIQEEEEKEPKKKRKENPFLFNLLQYMNKRCQKKKTTNDF